MRQTIRLATLALCLAAPLEAGELVGPPAPRAWTEAPQAHRWEAPVGAGLIVGANLMDVFTTRRMIAAGGREAFNPGLYGPEAQRIVPIKLAMAAAETGAFLWLQKRDKRLAWALVAGVVVGNAILAHHNQTVTRDLTR